jgi:hypothetical protein
MQPTRHLRSQNAQARRRLHLGVVRRATYACALAAAAITAACSGDSSTAPVQVAGARPMSTAQGMAVPHTFTDGAGSKLTIEGGGLTLSPNGTFALQYKGKLNALTFDLTDEGTYKLNGTTVTFTPEGGDPVYTGRVAGKSVVVDDFKIAGVKFDLAFTGN